MSSSVSIARTRSVQLNKVPYLGSCCPEEVYLLLEINGTRTHNPDILGGDLEESLEC